MSAAAGVLRAGRIRCLLALLTVAWLASACETRPPAHDAGAMRERARQAQDELSSETARPAR